jgi:hypothetical protein
LPWLHSKTTNKAALRCVCNEVFRIGNDFEADKDQSSPHSTHGELSAPKFPNNSLHLLFESKEDKAEDDTNLPGATPADQALSLLSWSLRAAFVHGVTRHPDAHGPAGAHGPTAGRLQILNPER